MDVTGLVSCPASAADVARGAVVDVGRHDQSDPNVLEDSCCASRTVRLQLYRLQAV